VVAVSLVGQELNLASTSKLSTDTSYSLLSTIQEFFIEQRNL